MSRYAPIQEGPPPRRTDKRAGRLHPEARAAEIRALANERLRRTDPAPGAPFGYLVIFRKRDGSKVRAEVDSYGEACALRDECMSEDDAIELAWVFQRSYRQARSGQQSARQQLIG